MVNATLLTDAAQQTQVDSGVFANLPNGIFKGTISTFDDVDPKIAEIIFFTLQTFHRSSYSERDFK